MFFWCFQGVEIETSDMKWIKLSNCLSVFGHFVGLSLKGLRVKKRPSWMFERVMNTPLNCVFK